MEASGRGQTPARNPLTREIHQPSSNVPETKRDGIFINTSGRPDLKDIIEKLKTETGILFIADPIYQSLRRWLEEFQRKPAPNPCRSRTCHCLPPSLS